MFDKMFKEFGNDPVFQEIINEFVDTAIMDINNQLKFKKINIDEDVIGATLLMVIKNKVGIEFLKTINLTINGADETAYSNVNDYLNKVELIYNNAENLRDKMQEEKMRF